MNNSCLGDTHANQPEEDNTNPPLPLSDTHSLDIIFELEYLRHIETTSKDQEEDLHAPPNIPRFADDIPLRNSYEQISTNLFASLKTVDATLHVTISCEKTLEYVKMQQAAAKFFREETYAGLNGSCETSDSTMRSKHAEYFDGMGDDEDFRDFVRDARFEQGRAGHRPDSKNIGNSQVRRPGEEREEIQGNVNEHILYPTSADEAR